MLIQNLQKFVLMFIHSRHPSGLRSSFIRPRVHRRERLIFNPIRYALPDDSRRFPLNRVFSIHQRLPLQKQQISRLRVIYRRQPSNGMLRVLSHPFQLVHDLLRPHGLQSLLLLFIRGGLFVLFREALLDQFLKHVRVFPLHVKILKHLVIQQRCCGG